MNQSSIRSLRWVFQKVISKKCWGKWWERKPQSTSSQYSNILQRKEIGALLWETWPTFLNQESKWISPRWGRYTLCSGLTDMLVWTYRFSLDPVYIQAVLSWSAGFLMLRQSPVWSVASSSGWQLGIFMCPCSPSTSLFYETKHFWKMADTSSLLFLQVLKWSWMQAN